MYHGKVERFDWRFALRALDTIAIIFSLPLSLALWSLLAREWPALPTPQAITWLNCVFLAICELIAIHQMGLYSWKSFMRWRTAVWRLARSLIVAGVAVAFIRLLVAPSPNLGDLPWFLSQLTLAFAIILIFRIGLLLVMQEGMQQRAVERIAFIGWSKRLDTVLKALVKEMGDYQQIGGSILEKPPAEFDEQHEHPVLGKIEDLEKILTDNRITLLLVDQGHVSPTDMRHIADIAADNMVSIRMIPSTFDIWANRLSMRVVAGIPLIGVSDLHHDRFGNRLLKRAIDIAGALAGLAFAAPIVGALAFLIRRESPGPIFFRQVRLGLNGKPFQIIKLRSMKINAEVASGAIWAVKDDPRRLKIGKFMREWNLDELPQFWNVLKGDMSMVGPRPERPEFVENFRDTIRYYNLRHTCKPGVTGWAAVHGLRGDTSLEDRLEYDLFYIENWSIQLDLRIILMTLAPPKNAY